MLPLLAAPQISELPARELVPGDIVEIHTGDKVPADVRILALKTAVMRVEQASLTGESVPVNKFAAAVGSEECELQVGGGASGVPQAWESCGRQAAVPLCSAGQAYRATFTPHLTPAISTCCRPRSACCLRAPASLRAPAWAW